MKLTNSALVLLVISLLLCPIASLADWPLNIVNSTQIRSQVSKELGVEVVDPKVCLEQHAVSALLPSRVLNSSFEMQSVQDDIPWLGVVEEYCYVRAHGTARLLFEKYGIRSLKIQLEAYSTRGLVAYSVDGRLFKFGNHIATAVLTQRPATGKIEIYVIDYAFSDQPIRISEWIKLFVEPGVNIRIGICSGETLFPEHTESLDWQKADLDYTRVNMSGLRVFSPKKHR